MNVWIWHVRCGPPVGSNASLGGMVENVGAGDSIELIPAHRNRGRPEVAHSILLGADVLIEPITPQELQALDTSAGELFKAPPIEWVAERLGKLQEVLERETPRSALMLRRILGPIRLVPVTPQVGKPYYQSETTLQVLDLLEAPEGGSNWSRWWRWRVSNPRPETLSSRLLHQ